jgi:iron complex outermembrane recepter protein
MFYLLNIFIIQMKYKSYTKILFCSVFFGFTQISFAQNDTLRGVVYDTKNNLPIAYANVLVLGTKLSAQSNENGKFELIVATKNNPYRLIISYLGYKTDTFKLQNTRQFHQFTLYPTTLSLIEIEVKGSSEKPFYKENPVPITIISSKKMEQTIESNLIDILTKNAPGVMAVKTGPNISKPFIRGLGYNRVLTLFDGIRQEGQQWGDEHGIEVDAYHIEKAEIIKGAGGIGFGSDAIAGVISFYPYLPKEKDGKIHSKLICEYQSNNGLIGNGLRIGWSNKNWLFCAKGSIRIARNYYNNIDKFVYNTGFQEKNLALTSGYQHKNGFLHFNFTMYDNFQGIPDGSRDSLSRKFTKQTQEEAMDVVTERPIVSDEELRSYTLSPLVQHIQHLRMYAKNEQKIGNGNLATLFAFTQNNRREYNHPTNINQPGLNIQLNTWSLRSCFTIANWVANTTQDFGVNGMIQENRLKNGTDFPIPNYELMEINPFYKLQWKKNKFSVQTGISYAHRYINIDNLFTKINPNNGFKMQAFLPDTTGANQSFVALKQIFSGSNFSLGLSYLLTENITLKANIAKGFRSPNIAEIASNGLDPGAHIIYIGNRNFVPETSLQDDIGILATFKNWTNSISIFNNNVQNYIYLSQLSDANGNPIELIQGNKTFQYLQADAQLYGLEGYFVLHPEKLKGFSFSNNFGLTYGFNRKSSFANKGVNGEYLPFIPPLRWISTVSQDILLSKYKFENLNLKAELEYNGAQNRFLALYQTETATASYALLNFSVATEIGILTHTKLQIQAQISNIFDTPYQSNMSRLKYFEYYANSPNGKTGIYGMGRNYAVKMILSF